MSTIQADIEARLSEVEPEVEVLLAEVVGGDLLRLFIDHPQGVMWDRPPRMGCSPRWIIDEVSFRTQRRAL